MTDERDLRTSRVGDLGALAAPFWRAAVTGASADAVATLVTASLALLRRIGGELLERSLYFMAVSVLRMPGAGGQ